MIVTIEMVLLYHLQYAAASAGDSIVVLSRR